jgi:hypothetical protein
VAAELFNIDVFALLLGDVDHGEGDDDGPAEFEHLGDEVEVSFEVGGVGEDDDDVWPRRAGDLAEEDLTGDVFIRAARGEGVGAWEIDKLGVGVVIGDIRKVKLADLFLDGDAGIISDFLAKTGESVVESVQSSEVRGSVLQLRLSFK